MFLALGVLTGCETEEVVKPGQRKPTSKADLVVWVGSESVEYYRSLATEFKTANPDFDLGISIVGADTGGAAGQMATDNTACGDIITIAHDNIGKLSQMSYIAPIVQGSDEEIKEGIELLEQIKADNTQEFQTVIENILGDGSDGYTYTFGVPYISQALFLYYDTRYVKDEEADTFEGLVQAAKRYDTEHNVTGTKSYTMTGADGYNFSFALLARNLKKGDQEDLNTSTLRLYENGVQYDCYAQSNDNVAVLKWMQRSVNDVNGVLMPSASSPWVVNIEQHNALSLIGGAWHYNSFKTAVKDNMGCKIIPTFTLQQEDVEGIEDVVYPEDKGKDGEGGVPKELRGTTDPAPKAGDVYRGGSFVDCKCFVINMAKINGDDERYFKCCKLLKYFSNKTAQNNSFKEALNVPAYSGADEFIETCHGEVPETAYLMAKAQTGMTPYGIPQPFINGTYNTYYYSKSTPDYYVNCIKNIGDTGKDVTEIRRTLFRMEYVWKHGSSPNTKSPFYPKSFPAETSTTMR